MKNIKLGCKAQNLVTGFEGVVTHRTTHITGCDRLCLVNGDNEKWSDINTTKFLDHHIEDVIEERGLNQFDDLDEALYDFGQIAVDKISGFKGTIIAKCIGITGDISYGISPSFHRDSKNNDALWFDESRIEVSKRQAIEVNTNSKRTGGNPNPPNGLYIR